ncbi:hypothetical protein LAZ67_1002008 [Cordylochernes scorpioides]|uniref:Uncharacterized protein n=1 Tax=Cordylochernes scorpioides TaxID=51811 RepID=A0ABY6JWY1_9ARAC|nr:hypothetical protein LAZ67_1002008 [Cordylochernes scorpioides]
MNRIEVLYDEKSSPHWKTEFAIYRECLYPNLKYCSVRSTGTKLHELFLLLLLLCPMKSLRYLHTSLSQHSQCSLSWVCKAAALGLCQISARLRPLLGMSIYV